MIIINTKRIWESPTADDEILYELEVENLHA